MTRQPSGVKWSAPPHTRAKIELVGRYVRVWAEILGRTCAGKVLTFVDGFAGPGEYTDHPIGSPVAAGRAIREAMVALGPKWAAAEARLILIEKDRRRHDHLMDVMAGEDFPANLKIDLRCCSFEDGIREAAKDYPDAFQASAPLLVFADPFGATGVPFATVEGILSSRTSELLYSFDADGVARIFAAGKSANADASLTAIYGGPHWRSRLEAARSHDAAAIAARECYLQTLRAIALYAYAFGVGRAAAHPDYYVVHACRSEKAAEVMTGLMRHMAHEGEFGFYEASGHQRVLFTDRDVPAAAVLASQSFAGKTVPLAEIALWLFNTAPWVPWKSVLRYLELDQQAIEALPGTIHRRAGTYRKDQVLQIRFR